MKIDLNEEYNINDLHIISDKHFLSFIVNSNEYIYDIKNGRLV